MAEIHTFPQLIATKQSANVLSDDQIEWFIQQTSSKNAHDAQIGAMLMAIFLQGMTREETVALTSCMTKSGEILSWPDEWKHLVVDKHSTGGVGDKISLVLAPALAACGLKVPMISGRSLGFTGGTLDKLESIPGYNIQMSSEQMVDILDKVGCCIVGQTDTLVPADKTLYALRDITSTVASAPLICASIISKKAAEGLTCLVLDVKYGRGCFQSTVQDAEKLAHLLTATSNGMGIKTTSFITNIDDPLGFTVGNALEVLESIECLQGNGPADVLQLVIAEGGELLYLNGRVDSYEEGKDQIRRVIQNGDALSKFKKMLIAQGVDLEVAANICTNPKGTLPLSGNTTELIADKSGTIESIDALICAEVSSSLGAGRLKPTDDVTHITGLCLKVKRGDYVKAGEPLVTVYHMDTTMPIMLKEKLQSAFVVSDHTVDKSDGVNHESRIHSIIREKRSCRPVMQSQ